MRSYCLQDLLPPYLETLTAKLLALLQNGQKTVQEGALTAMASVADCAKTHFINFYSQVRTHPPDSVQCLRPLLRTPQGRWVLTSSLQWLGTNSTCAWHR